MKNKIIGTFVCTLIIATTFPTAGTMNIKNASPVCSDIIRIKIVAKVHYEYDPNNLLGGVIKINDTITGKYTYDSRIPDEVSDPTLGFYNMSSTSCYFEVKAGGLVFRADQNKLEYFVIIYNDYDIKWDAYGIVSVNNLQLSNGMSVSSLSWSLSSTNLTTLSSDVLPTTAPDLADWEVSNNLELEGKDPSDPYKEYLIEAHVT